MGSFSERMGLKPVRQTLQTDTMDDALRNSIWNLVFDVFFAPARDMLSFGMLFERSHAWLLFEAIWAEHFKRPIDATPVEWAITLELLRTAYFALSWYQVYDLTEFIAKSGPPGARKSYVAGLNGILSRELSGYRMVNGQIVSVTGEEEITAIEAAAANEVCPGAAEHVRTALGLLSQKPNPDLRNSIKESISAVESAAKFIAGDDKADLAKALKAISSKIDMHGALEKGLLSIYGYTSDGDGIRHALVDESNLTVADAKFMLVACSAFVNYLIEKGLEAGLIQAAG